MFLTTENDIFAFQNIAIRTRETSRKEIWPIVSAFLQLRYVRSIKLHSIKRVSMGLTDKRKTAQNLVDSRKNWKILNVSRK